MSKLVLSGLTKIFGAHTAVDHVNLTLRAGEFVSLLGPSGCGKTTTLRMLAGFIDPTSGTIAMDGKTLSSSEGAVPPERRGMSMIFQSYAIWPNMTVAENVGFGLELRKLGRAETAERVRQILGVVKMAHLADRYPSELSGGQQQRVALARAIVIKPEVLLLDEPLSNLDANLREEMRFEIRRLHDEFKITTVYVTHDQSEAMVTSDRIAVMNEGRIEQVDAPQVLYTRPKTRFVAGFIGRTNFVEATCNGADVVFDRFAVPRAVLRDGAALRGTVTFSIRPQSMRLHRTAPAAAANGRLGATVRIVERAYLGEHWDYVVVADGGAAKLKVAAPPPDIYAVGDQAWLELDPDQIAAVG